MAAAKNTMDVERVVQQIQQGHEQLRTELISFHKNFIQRYTGFICKRQLHWDNDDELSIALIAFNRAIDKFDLQHKKSFLNFARILIKNSLIDYFRAQSRFQALSLTGFNQEKDSQAELAASWNSYRQEIENRNRAYEIQLFVEKLAQFNLTLQKLVKHSPRHKDTRDNLKKIACQISENPEIVQKIYQQQRLPLKEIQLLTGASRKILEKWRKHLLSLVIILTNGEMESLAAYIREKGVFCSE